MTAAPARRERPEGRLHRPANRLPYFDPILERLRQGDPEYIATSGRHVHWGYWPEPRATLRTAEDFARAQEAMSVHLCDRAGIRDGQAVLDAGCGFGGTLDSLNERLEQMTLRGINIDERQLERARQQVIARPGNSVSFVLGDACRLPFADASFDHVLAVECIMHFPDRLRFLEEARRVLRPGGRLTVSDFCPIVGLPAALTRLLAFLNAAVTRTYGPSNVLTTRSGYASLGRRAGFASVAGEDITANTLPTYPIVRRLIRQGIGWETDWVTAGIEWLSRARLLRYLILSFATPDAA